MPNTDAPRPTTAPRPDAGAAAPHAARPGGPEPLTTELRTAKLRTAKPRTAKTKVAAVAVVCGKCAKRQGLRPRDLGALLKKAAKRAARRAARRAAKGAAGPAARRGKLCVVASGCLGPCPKRAVAVATGASLAAGRVMLLDPAAGPEAALALLPEFGPNADLGGCDRRGSDEPLQR